MAKKELERDDAEAVDIDGDSSEPRVYELGFHIDGELPESEAKKAYEEIRGKIASVGTLLEEGSPRKTALAYTVSRMEHAGRRDFNTSFFAWIAYEADGEGHEAVGEAVRAENRIFRFIDIRTTKEEARHSAELEELYARTLAEEKVSEEEEEVSDSELDAALKEAGV
jgi:ribosomal protein S6